MFRKRAATVISHMGAAAIAARPDLFNYFRTRICKLFVRAFHAAWFVNIVKVAMFKALA